jgi:arabinose-5-phosphate isomerase
VALLDARGFRRGLRPLAPRRRLGRKLLMHVRDVMRSGDAVPQRRPGASLWRADARDERQGPGRIGGGGRRRPCVLGIFTDGDLRRLSSGRADLRASPRAT